MVCIYLLWEFDYLLITVADSTKDKYGLYLLDFEQVQKKLKNSYHYNKDCDENGYDKKGQIKLYLHNKADCLAIVEMDSNNLKYFKQKYNCDVSSSERNLKWLTSMNNCVKEQIFLSKENND